MHIYNKMINIYKFTVTAQLASEPGLSCTLVGNSNHAAILPPIFQLVNNMPLRYCGVKCSIMLLRAEMN